MATAKERTQAIDNSINTSLSNIKTALQEKNVVLTNAPKLSEVAENIKRIELGSKTGNIVIVVSVTLSSGSGTLVLRSKNNNFSQSINVTNNSNIAIYEKLNFDTYSYRLDSGSNYAEGEITVAENKVYAEKILSLISSGGPPIV